MNDKLQKLINSVAQKVKNAPKLVDAPVVKKERAPVVREGKPVKRGRKALPSTVRVSHVDDHLIRGADGKLHSKYVRAEVQWKEYKALGKLRTSTKRVDFRREREDGEANGRFGKVYADRQQWEVKLFRTDDPKVAEFRLIGKVGRVPLVRELAMLYAEMFSVGLHVTYVHENGGYCVRGKPKVLGIEEEDVEEFRKRYHLGLARATSTIEQALVAKMLPKCKGDRELARRACAKEVRAALAKPRANADNEWGYGLKRKDMAPLKSSQEYVLNVGFKYMTDKAKRSKKGGGKGGGGAFRVGTESPVVKDLHRPAHREEVVKNIKAFISHSMVLDATQAKTMAATRKFRKVLGDVEKTDTPDMQVLAEHESRKGHGIKRMCKLGRKFMILDDKDTELYVGKKTEVEAQWKKIVRKG